MIDTGLTINKPSLRQLAWMALYIGITGYGGGPAIMAYARQIFVERLRWASADDFATSISLSQLLPGANALGVMTFLGYRIGGSPGALLSAVCFLFPSFVFMTVLSAAYFTWGNLPVVTSLFVGLGALVVALLVNALVSMGRPVMTEWRGISLAAVAFVAMQFFHAPLWMVIFGGAVLGWLLFLTVDEERTVIAHAPAPRWIWWGLLALAVCAALVWFTRSSPATFFFLSMLRVGAFTFGGGFAALPLFQQEALGNNWLTMQQFRDGIALGQVTPGPILVSATFIGYKVLGVWGAFLGTVAVFLPGALGMFLLARQHALINSLAPLRAMIKGVMAAFIGLILSITITLATQSLIDWKTWSIAILGAIALLWWKREPWQVILVGAVVSVVAFRG